MLLSDWRPRAPHRESMAAKVLVPATDVLALLGAGRDPECWILWGDDPGVRYTILAPAPSGLVIVNVRVNVPGEGPRAAGKLTRWQRVQVGELSAETQGGHRVIAFQVESQLLRGVDTQADEVATFVDAVFAAMDGRTSGRIRALAFPAATPDSPGAAGLLPDPKASEP